MSRQVTPASLAVQSTCRTQALAAFTALSLTGAVARQIREPDVTPYCKIGDFFEVADASFDDGDGNATRVTGALNFYSKKGTSSVQLAEKYVNLMTAPTLTVTGFRVLLHDSEFTLIHTEEDDPKGATLHKSIVDLTLTVEPN